MAELSEFYSYFHHMVCTVAIYGSDEPHFFNGHLLLRTYYKDSDKTTEDAVKSNAYMLDTLFAETNKSVRRLHRERYDENRDLVVLPVSLLGEPYRIVYNRLANRSVYEDNSLKLLQGTDPNAKGLAIILKESSDGTLNWLNEVEARTIISTLEPILDHQ